MTQSHKAEVSLLQQQYQTQLENLTLSHQQSLAQVNGSYVLLALFQFVFFVLLSGVVVYYFVKARENVEKSVKTSTEEHYHSHLEQLQNVHTAKLRCVHLYSETSL